MSQIPPDRSDRFDERLDERREPKSAGAPYTGVPHGTRTHDAYGPAGDAPQRYAPSEGSPTPTSAVVLLIVSGLGALLFVWSGIGIVWAAPVVLAIVAMVRKDEVALSKRLTKIGWIVYAVLAVLTVLLISLAVAGLVLFANAASLDQGSYDPGTIAFTTGWLGAR